MSNILQRKELPFKIIWLNGMPRSGTNWLCQILDSNENVLFKMAPLFSYSFKNSVDNNSSKEEWIDFFEQVYFSNDEFINQVKKRSNGDFPAFLQKVARPEFMVIKDTRHHQLMARLLELFPSIKLIHIVRNPCGAIHSWLTASKEFPSTHDPMQEWRTGACRKINESEFWGFDDWKLLTLQYMELEKSYPDQVKLISYEDMVNDAHAVTRTIFEFSGLKITEQTEKFLIESQSTHSDLNYSVFKDKSVKDKWKNSLNVEIISEINRDLKGTVLEKYLY